ncbi:death-associated inhibitor of apoptosis 2-like [Ostrea edulis]|uniref:death-associated inhibitor of apoptosis 2-like n=1 Tax=Ostrea edulis TaxID=37623 RepID=UPI0024AEA325|nr:death-associated inhibitor of apoptosis 2-like [Ostrea edulis]
MTDYESLHNPGTPRYALLSDRVASFENAPEHLQKLLPTIAEAGYFYKGYGDNTCCFYCNFGLHHWGAVDNPWIQHAYWYPHCPYLKCNKGKQWVRQMFDAVSRMRDTGKNWGDLSVDSVENPATTTEKCHLCLERDLRIAFLPCGHLCTCAICATGLK